MNEKKSVFGMLGGRAQAEQAVSALNGMAFRMEKVSLLLPSPPASVTGALGLLVGLDTLTIPGLGPVLMAGPVRATLGRFPLTETSIAVALASVGVPERQAKLYEEKIGARACMMSVHTIGGRQIDAVERILVRHGGVDLSVHEEPSTGAPSVTSTAK